jgi:hypothetical protein
MRQQNMALSRRVLDDFPQVNIVATILDLATISHQLHITIFTSSNRFIHSRKATLPNLRGPVLGGISSIYPFNTTNICPIPPIVEFEMIFSSTQVFPLIDSFNNSMNPTIRSNAMEFLNSATSVSELIFFSGTVKDASFSTRGNESKPVITHENTE